MAYTFRQNMRRRLIKVYQGLGVDRLLMQAGFFDRQIEAAIKKFAVVAYDPHELKRDIKECYNRYLTTPQEYFLFGFQGKDDSYRSSFLSDKYRIRQLIRKTGERKFVEDLTDKYGFYLRASDFFKREAIKCGGKGGVSFGGFKLFLAKHGRAFAKPLSASYGQGAHIIMAASDNELRKKYDELNAGEWILEECIVQSPEMAVWNESSVNTVRIPMFSTSEGFKILNPFFRTGRKGCVVDNAGGGGIFANIDENTGIIISEGFDENNNYHSHHPDSGLEYPGWTVPEWENLVELASEVFRNCFPDHKYIGFDFALTEKGWVLIEGNWGQFVGQYASKKGVKDQFMKYLNS